MEINFYRTTERPYGIFSNFSKHPILIASKIYPTVEHFYQSMKFSDSPDAEEIRLAPRAMDAARMGREPHRPLCLNWEFIKDEVMRIAIQAKVNQHQDVRELLISTGDSVIIEHTAKDHYWADGGDESGLNRLGIILMETRAIFRSKSYLNAPPFSGLLSMSNPSYTEWSPAILVSIGKRGNDVAEQLAGQMNECDHFHIPATLAPAATIPFQDYGIGIVIVGFEDTNSTDLTRVLRHQLAGLTPRPLLMGIILPPPATDPAIHYDFTALNGCIDCIWQPEPQQVSTILPGVVNHWLDVYLNGSLVAFNYEDYHRLFGVPPFCPCIPLDVRMVYSAWIEDDEEAVIQWVKAIATELSASTLERVQAMLVILEVSQKFIHHFRISHYENLIQKSNCCWATQGRQVHVALSFSPSSVADETFEGDVRITLFLR